MLLNRLLAVVLFILVVANIAIYGMTRDARDRFESQKRVIQQGQALEPIYRQLIRQLAAAAAKKDDQLTAVLGEQGINVTINQKAKSDK